MKYLRCSVILVFIGFLLFCVGQSSQLWGQQSSSDNTLDSLHGIVYRASSDTTRVNALNALSRYYSRTLRKYDSAIAYGERALVLSRKAKFTRGEANAEQNLGNINRYQVRYQKSLEHYFRALEFFTEIKNHLGEFENLLLIGEVFRLENIDEEAAEYYRKALRVAEGMQYPTGKSLALNNLALVLKNKGNAQEALQYLQEAIQLNLATDAKNEIPMKLSNIGTMYNVLGQYDSAEVYARKVLEMQYSSAVVNRRAVINANVVLAVAASGKKQYLSALEYAERAIVLADSLGINIVKDEGSRGDALLVKSQVLDSLGRHSEAFATYRAYIQFRDSLVNYSTLINTKILKETFENERTGKALLLLQADNEQKALERRAVVVSLIFVTAIVLILGYFYRQKADAAKEILRQKNILEEQAREIELTNTKLNESNVQLMLLNKDVKQKVIELETIDTIVQTINNEIELAQLLPKLLEQGHILVPSVEKSSILMISDDRTYYHFIAFHNYSAEKFAHLRLTVEETLERYVSTKEVQHGVYILRDFSETLADGTAFNSVPPKCSLVMTISLDGNKGEHNNIEPSYPEGILFFDNFLSENAFTEADIERLQRFRKHVVTAFEKAKIVSSEHTAAALLAEQNKQLQELDREKNEFLGIAAHDMKSPLAGIMINAGILRRFFERLTVEERLRTIIGIEQTAKRMSAIVSNLLDINAIESGKMNIISTRVDIVALVKEVIEQYRERATAKKLSIQATFEQEQIIAFADSSASSQVLDNLFSNAVKYSPEGKNIRIVVNLVQDNSSWVRLAIHDEGAGISAEDMGKMFGKFARLSSKPTGGEDSTGLGLSIVKRLVEAMNGRVWCESEIGCGASFIVELPLAKMI